MPFRSRLRLLVLSLLCLPAASVALAAPADADALFKQGLAAESALDSKRALELFQQADQAKPNDSAILQKISKQLSDSTFDQPDTAQKQRLIEQALTYAKRSYELDPKSAVAALSIAICYGKLGLYEDNRSRIADARLVKEYAEKALALDPNYDWANHVLGRWNYEVATLGHAKRFVVGVIYGGLPEASTEQAVTLLKRAVELAPEKSAHHIDLGFAYVANHQPDLAKKAFTDGLALPSREKYDEETKSLGRAALAKLGP